MTETSDSLSSGSQNITSCFSIKQVSSSLISSDSPSLSCLDVASRGCLLASQIQWNSSESQRILPLSRLALNYLLEPLENFDAEVDFYFSDLWQMNGDERTSRLPFMSGGPWKLILATFVYLYLIKLLLPSWMSKRRAYELQWPIRCYNLSMVFSNLYAFYHGTRILDFGLKCFGCQVINHRDYSAEAIELLHYGWLFMLSRLVEWIDTIFFVLRKKHNQVSKLHVFHHSFVPILCWFYLKFHPGATMAFFPLVNTFVHTIMYTYYFLATFGSKVQPYLWWKRHLTSLQITQFVLILIQLASIPLSTNERCQYPRAFLYVAFAGAILFLWLFYTYYLDTYPSRPTDASERSLIGRQRYLGAPRPNHVDKQVRFRDSAARRDGSSKALDELVDDAIGMTLTYKLD